MSEENASNEWKGFIGVHIGAGQHSEAKTPQYLSICRQACERGISLLKNGDSALNAAVAATTVLEDDGSTNAGFGSNLTEYGTIEMDCGAMDGSNLLFGGVGGMPGIKNPIIVAQRMVDEQKNGLLPLGRVPPSFLVGKGARDWAIRRGIPHFEESSLVSEKARKLYNHYKKKLELHKFAHKRKRLAEAEAEADNRVSKSPRPMGANNEEEEDDGVGDTVGVVVVDGQGNIATTVSSGGIALKQPGRVGQAPCFGSGCWAQNASEKQETGIGVSTTGCGEHLVRTLFARDCATSVLGSRQNQLQGLQNFMEKDFLQSPLLANIPEKLAGALCLSFCPKQKRGEFMWTHTTASMGLAYQSTTDPEPKCVMSRKPSSLTSNGQNQISDRNVLVVDNIAFNV